VRRGARRVRVGMVCGASAGWKCAGAGRTGKISQIPAGAGRERTKISTRAGL